MWCDYLLASGVFRSWLWLPFLTQLELESAVFLTHPFPETKAALRTNKIQILELKDDCFLFHSKKAGLGRERDMAWITGQDHARARLEPLSHLPQVSMTPVYCWLGPPGGELELPSLLWPVNSFPIGQEKWSQAAGARLSPAQS